MYSKYHLRSVLKNELNSSLILKEIIFRYLSVLVIYNIIFKLENFKPYKFIVLLYYLITNPI